jgi:hypothetical protein
MQKKTLSEIREAIVRFTSELCNKEYSPDIELMRATIADLDSLIGTIKVTQKGLQDNIARRFDKAYSDTRHVTAAIIQRKLHGVPDDIHAIKADLACRERAYESKSEVLKSQGLSGREIAFILPEVTDQDRAEAAARIAALEAELEAYRAFDASYPDPDYHLLSETGVAHLCPKAEAA